MPKSFKKPTPIKGVAPLTEEAKKAKVAQFFMQKRETFSLNILCSLIRGNGEVNIQDVVKGAVEIADALLEELYPIPSNGDKTE